MDQRLLLQALLEELLGSEAVYFQPPDNLTMVYPAIVYERDRIDTKFAGNKPYKLDDRYAVTVIYDDPDSDLPKKLAALPKCSFNRHFVTDGLYHDAFSLYF